ncbi:hypothetical protein D3C71_1797850 [compost metagenome]
MTIGQHGHLQLVGQIAVGHEAQVVAGELGRSQDHQAVPRAQRLAHPGQVARLFLQRIAQVRDIEARGRRGHGPGFQRQRVPGPPAASGGGGQGQRRGQRVLP